MYDRTKFNDLLSASKLSDFERQEIKTVVNLFCQANELTNVTSGGTYTPLSFQFLPYHS